MALSPELPLNFVLLVFLGRSRGHKCPSFWVLYAAHGKRTLIRCSVVIPRYERFQFFLIAQNIHSFCSLDLHYMFTVWCFTYNVRN